jgi:NAD(P)-dependent dehydrogenase (short-subunit alcohol dehydrogenase family)
VTTRLAGRVAIVTGAGRGLGRAHALALAQAGAAVVVNDLGGDVAGEGDDVTPARSVVDEIHALGGEAVVSGHDVADWDQAEDLVRLAVRSFGRLDVLVNNAGILRDRTLANMDERDWDDVVRVHLKGHAAPTRHAVAHWKARAKAGAAADASVVHTSSASGLVGNFGQASYGAAKLGVVALSSIVNLECGRFGVRSNVIAPVAATRMAATTGGDSTAPGYDPARVSPLVVWLATEGCPASGQVLQVHGNRVVVLAVPAVAADLRTSGAWTPEALDDVLPDVLVVPLAVPDLMEEKDFA